MGQPSTPANPPKNSSESSNDISSDKREAILFGCTLFLLVLIAWYFEAQTIIIAALLGIFGWAGCIHQRALVHAHRYMADYRDEIDRHSHALNILLDERGRLRAERGEKWRRPQ